MQRCRYESERRIRTWLPFLMSIPHQGCRTGAVTVEEGSDEPAIYISWNGHVERPGSVTADRLITFPIRFQLQPVFVQPSASVTVGEGIGVEVLDGHEVYQVDS